MATKAGWITRRENGNDIPWNKGLKGYNAGSKNSRYTRVKKNCLICNDEFIVKNYRKNEAKYCSHVCEKISKRKLKPTYNAIHKWVNFQLGTPLMCKECGFVSKNRRQFHWANISKMYKRDLTDWIRLCVKCHHSWDKKGGSLRCIAVS
jgi:hypothetical protein